MKYIKVRAETPNDGTDMEDYFSVNDSMSDEEIDAMCEELVLENGENYEYIETGQDGDFETDEDRDWYYDNCIGGWEYITEEEYRRRE